MMGAAKSKAGFTLLEVMIALAILSLVAVAFLRAQAASVRLVDESSQISVATLLAREKMAELESIGFPDIGKESGKWEEGKDWSGRRGDALPRFRWEKVVSATDMFNLRKGQIKVFWKEGSKERSLELVSYFAKH
jgi:general secretion pathway protein I